MPDKMSCYIIGCNLVHLKRVNTGLVVSSVSSGCLLLRNKSWFHQMLIFFSNSKWVLAKSFKSQEDNLKPVVPSTFDLNILEK